MLTTALHLFQRLPVHPDLCTELGTQLLQKQLQGSAAQQRRSFWLLAHMRARSSTLPASGPTTDTVWSMGATPCMSRREGDGSWLPAHTFPFDSQQARRQALPFARAWQDRLHAKRLLTQAVPTRSCVGFSPATPHAAAGMRMLPPPSLPAGRKAGKAGSYL